MKKLILFFTAILILSFVGCLQLINFTNNLSSENLTFTENQNITRNISVWKSANFTSATMNLGGQQGYYNETLIVNSSVDVSSCYVSSDPYIISFGRNENFLYLGSRQTQGTVGKPIQVGICRRNVTDNSYIDFTYLPGYTNLTFGSIVGFTIMNDSLYIADGSKIYIYYENMTYTGDNITVSAGINGLTDNETDLLVLSGSYKILVYNSSKDNFLNYSINYTGGTITYSPLTNKFYAGRSSDSGEFLSYNSTFGNRTNIFNISNSEELYVYEKNLLIEVSNYNITTYNFLNLINRITNASLSINNTNIWNYSGEFNQTNNKTNDFYTTLNTALNKGKCNCVGCVLSGNNCTINFIFHSDTAGLLEYSDLKFSYNNYPLVTLSSPSNNSYSSAYREFNCSAIDEIKLVNITFYLWNSTNNLVNTSTKAVAGLSNSTIFNYTMNSTGLFKWNCKATNNESRSYLENNFTLNVDVSNVVVNLNYPQNNSWVNKITSVSFNYTPDHATQIIDTCELWGNFTGTWAMNKTNKTINQAVINTFPLTLTEGTYLWNVACNTTTNSAKVFSTNNYTSSFDVTIPNITLDYLQQVGFTQQMNFNFTTTDKNLEHCSYTILNLAGTVDGLNNATINCNELKTVTLSAFATYNLTVYSYDLAGNMNFYAELFSISSTGITLLGGGGGSPHDEEGVEEETEEFQSICISFRATFDIAWAKAKLEPDIWKKIKIIFIPFWDRMFCDAAMIVPI